MALVRPARGEDADQICSLFCKTFRNGSQKGRASLSAYLRELYLTPDPDSEKPITSLVALDGEHSEKIIGFIGADRADLSLGDRPIVAAICGAYMVDEQKRDFMTGPRLLKHFLSGPQDLSLSETANKTASAMWQSLGGRVLPNESFEYFYPLHPARLGLEIARRKWPVFVLARPLAPLCDWTFARLTGWKRPDKDVASAKESQVNSEKMPQIHPASRDEFIASFQSLSKSFQLRPAFSDERLLYMLKTAEQKRAHGPARYYVLEKKGQSPFGAVLCHYSPGGPMRILQPLARPGFEGMLIDKMIEEAKNTGASMLKGRTHSRYMPSLMGRDIFYHHVASTVIHSNDAEILEAFTNGDGLINGLVGERWYRLLGDVFDDPS